MWSKIIYNTDNHSIQSPPAGIKNYRKIFTDPIAEGLYQDMQLIWNHITYTKSEKSFWYDFASGIPEKFGVLNLFIRPFGDFCRTCIITDEEIDVLVQMDLEQKKIFQTKIKDEKRFRRELNYLIPLQLKKIGYEVLRREEIIEIDMLMIRKLARADHAKYLHEMRTRKARLENDQEDTANLYITDFNSLPLEIQYSNIDNTFHIPTKLLSIGYKIRPVKKGFNPVTLSLNGEEIETMAKVEHIRWSWEKRLNGWRYGKERDNIKKTHPSLIPYEELDESEKVKDRQLVKLIPSLLHDISYEAYPISPSRINKISYAIKPQSIIQRLLSETRKLNDEISKLIVTTPEINERIISINSKIEETINEVQGSYTYARHIQEIFLPEDIYIRECFPESFVLFKPKNIVSGDFYFFSKRNDLVIFALADCTGHGIPGALISTIGYGNLDMVVNVNKINDPVKILRHLYTYVHRFMRRNMEGHGLQDDMEITLCVLNTTTNLLTFSGSGNIIYHVTEGEIFEIKSEYYKDDSNLKQEYTFSLNTTQMKAGDTLYLCSDGFPDQMGGKDHRRYQKKKLMNFLHQIHKSPMAEQNDLLYEEIEKWREEADEDQTDDISVIGIRI